MAKTKRQIDVRELTSKVARDYGKDSQYARDKQFIAFKERQKRYSQSRSGRLAGGIKRGMSFIRSPTRSLYARQIEPTGYSGSTRRVKSFSGRGRGRPVGTVKYRDAQGNPIGVYEYRKLLALRNFRERQAILERSAVNPAQRRTLEQIRQRELMSRQSPESRTLPDTSGSIFLSGINNEIDNATHAFD